MYRQPDRAYQRTNDENAGWIAARQKPPTQQSAGKCTQKLGTGKCTQRSTPDVTLGTNGQARRQASFKKVESRKEYCERRKYRSLRMTREGQHELSEQQQQQCDAQCRCLYH